MAADARRKIEKRFSSTMQCRQTEVGPEEGLARVE
jgi:hypothetical protein